MSDFRTKAADEKFCTTCGAIILEKAEICPKCGVRQPISGVFDPNASSRDWLTTLLLAIFLGGLGIHRFYTGKIGTGILMMLFGWLTCGIWWLIDIIMVATGRFRDIDGKYIISR